MGLWIALLAEWWVKRQRYNTRMVQTLMRALAILHRGLLSAAADLPLLVFAGGGFLLDPSRAISAIANHALQHSRSSSFR